jgi:exosortase/archaeosortase
MKRILFLLILLPVLTIQAQVKITILRMDNKTQQFGGTGYLVGQRMELKDSTISFRITHDVTSSQSVATVFSNGWYEIIGGETIHPVHYLITADSQNDLSITFNLLAASLIIYNNFPLESTQWSGIGTSTLHLNCGTKHFDFITIIK